MQTSTYATLHRNVHLFRRRSAPPEPPDAKPYRVTIHAAGDQWQTIAMGPGDAVGVGNIRVDIDTDQQNTIHVRPIT